MFIFLKDLQAESTEIVGYFLFSHIKQNKDRLKNTIQSFLLKRLDINEQVSIRWQKIQQKSVAASEGENIIKAYHVEAITGRSGIVGKGIAQLYSSTLARPPLGEKMRFIRYKKGNQHSTEITSYQDIANRQNWFSQKTSFASTYEISNLDETSGFKKSLREYILSMKHSSKTQLFCSVDWNWNQSAVILIFPTCFESEARDRIVDLASYMHHIAGDRMLIKCFTPEAAERAVNSPWNIELGRAVSNEVLECDNILESCKGIEWLTPQEEKVEVEFQPAQQKPTALFHFNPIDDSSLPTLENEHVQGQQNIKEKSKVQQERLDISMEDSLTDISEDDDMTLETLSSRMVQMEKQQKQHQADISKKLDWLMSVMQAQNGGGQTSQTFSNSSHSNSPAPSMARGAGS